MGPLPPVVFEVNFAVPGRDALGAAGQERLLRTRTLRVDATLQGDPDLRRPLGA